MTESWSERNRLKSVGGVVLAAASGVLLTVLVLILFYRAGGLPAVAPPVALGNEAATAWTNAGSLSRNP